MVKDREVSMKFWYEGYTQNHLALFACLFGFKFLPWKDAESHLSIFQESTLPPFFASVLNFCVNGKTHLPWKWCEIV